MIPLGSCTMKLNATSEMIPITLPTVNRIHPFVPPEAQVQAATEAHAGAKLKGYLAEITGFHTVSLQPNAGSQGEYAGLLAIQELPRTAARTTPRATSASYPVSAHGTNPASGCHGRHEAWSWSTAPSNGEIDMADLRQQGRAAQRSTCPAS